VQGMATWYKLKMPQGHTDFAAPSLASKVGATVGAGGANTAHSLAFCTKYEFDHLRDSAGTRMTLQQLP
jgi:hypothetical protein